MTDTADTAADTADCLLALGGGCSRDAPPAVPTCADTAGGSGTEDSGALLAEGGGQACGCQPVAGSPGGLGLLGVVVLVALWRRLPVAGLLLLVAGLLAGERPGWAVDAQHLQVADGGRFLTLAEPWRGVPWSVRFSLATSYSRELVLLRSGSGETAVLLDRVLTHEAGTSIALGELARLGVGLPLHARYTWQGQPEKWMRGDLTLWGSIHLSRPDAEVQRLWTVAVDVPSVAYERLLGDIGAVRGALSSGRALSPRLHLAGQAGVRLQQSTPLPGVDWGRRLEGAVGVDWTPRESRGTTLEILASAPLGDGEGPSTLPAEVFLTTRRRTGPAWVRVGGGMGIGVGIGAPRWRVLATLSDDNLHAGDIDQDGIVDMVDACPMEPEDFDFFRDRDGCPEPDNDLDGILDPVDACPVEAEVFNQYLDEDGCPDAVAILSVVVASPEPSLEQATLQVGELAPVIAIPGEPTPFRVESGRRIPVEVSADGHRTLYAEIPLLGDKEVVLTLEPIQWGRLQLRVTDLLGAPLDAVLDTGEPIPAATGADLRVPSGLFSATISAPGHQSAAVEIPIAAAAQVAQVVVLEPSGPWLEDARLRVGRELRFDLDSAALTPDSQEALLALAAWLRAHPEIRLLRIEGLADALGSPAYNYGLSQARAEAVRAALVAAGIAPGRLQAIGSGEALADPTGLGMRAEERSVRFLVIVWDAETGERPDGAERITTDEP